jgi:hypothetical protein
MLRTVTGRVVGKRKMTLRNAVQVHAQTLMYQEYLPKLMGPGVKWSGQNIYLSEILWWKLCREWGYSSSNP